jgi:hypothetical protein
MRHRCRAPVAGVVFCATCGVTLVAQGSDERARVKLRRYLRFATHVTEQRRCARFRTAHPQSPQIWPRWRILRNILHGVARFSHLANEKG